MYKNTLLLIYDISDVTNISRNFMLRKILDKDLKMAKTSKIYKRKKKNSMLITNIAFIFSPATL